MFRYQFWSFRALTLNALICMGAMSFLSNYSFAMMSEEGEAKYIELALGPVRFPFQELREVERREFSTLVYKVGSKRRDKIEIETYCTSKAKGEAAAKWSVEYKNKALTDIGVMEKFYTEIDASIVSLKALIGSQQITLIVYNNAMAKIKEQRLQADALFHYFYSNYSSEGLGSLMRKIYRYHSEGVFCRPEPDFTIPEEGKGKQFFALYDALVPWNMRVNGNA